MFDYIWAEKYRPKTIKEIILDSESRNTIEGYLEDKQIAHLLLAGPPGSGKTSLAKIIVNELQCDSLYINASDEAGIDTIRSKVIQFAQTMSFDGGIKIVILDEADGLSANQGMGKTSAQGALRNVMEEYSKTTRFILTCNYPQKIIDPIHSRCVAIKLEAPFKECAKYCANILKQEKVEVTQDQKDLLIKLIRQKFPDMRKIINSLQTSTHNNKLQIQEQSAEMTIATKIVDKIIKNTKLNDIRKYIIQNEMEFQDYHELLQDIFEVVYNHADISDEKRPAMLLIISEAMYRHTQVMDPEINCFSCIIQLSQA